MIPFSFHPPDILNKPYGSRYPEFYQEMSNWLKAGKITYLEQQINGLEKAPEAFIGRLEGKNFGKGVIKVAAD